MSFLANRNVRIFNSTMSVSTLNTSAIAISTLTGSTMNASSINVSTLSGSTLNASTMTGNQITISTLTVSSINNGTPGVAAYSTFNASSINVTSTTTTSTLSTLVVNTGSLTVSGLTSVGNRLLGSTDNSPTGNFWIGLRGSGSEGDRLAISLVGDATTGAVSQITLQKPVSCASNVSVTGTVSAAYIGASTAYLATDDRIISPSEIPTSSARFYFASYPNNGGTEYADTIGFNTYLDASGGNSNLLMLRKNSIGLRIYQGGFGSASPFSTYRDAVLANNNGDVEASGFIINGGGAYVPGCIYTDANWGMLFRARVPGNQAEFVWYNSVGTERMRIDTAGTIIKMGNTAGNDTRLEGGTTTNSGYVNFIQGSISRGYIGNATSVDMDIVAQNGAKLNFYTAGERRMIINTSGNVGIGVAAPSTKLHIYDIQTNVIRMQTSSVDNAYIASTYDYIFISANYNIAGGRENIGRGSSQIVMYSYANSGGLITFNTSPSMDTFVQERMRITSNGNVFMNTPSSIGNGLLQITSIPGGTAQDAISCRACFDGNYIIAFHNTEGVFRGCVAGVNSSSVSYLTSSDRRLKDNIHPIEGSLSIVNQLKPVHFRWKNDDQYDFGFIAQDVYKVLPHLRPNFSSYIKDCSCQKNDLWNGTQCDHCLSMNDEPVDEEGNPKYYSLDYGKFSPYLIGAVKELTERNTHLESENAQLKSQVTSLSASHASLLAWAQTQGFVQ